MAGTPFDSQLLGFSDDGEPAGTAGKPMLNALQGSQIGEISAVVVRYYGGILLGTGGLVRAYGNGVQQALKLLATQLKVEREHVLLTSDYDQINLIQHLCEQQDVLIESQDFQEKVHFQLALRPDKRASFERQLSERSAGQLVLQEIK